MTSKHSAVSNSCDTTTQDYSRQSNLENSIKYYPDYKAQSQSVTILLSQLHNNRKVNIPFCTI